ncbi:MAG: hypothetical protein RL088_1438 [Verrucomicrobiota bacterium]|jgi:putative membrane-bound dehydrogenase-like protein
MRPLQLLAFAVVSSLPLHAETWLKCHIRVPDNLVTPQEKDLWRDSMVLTLGELRGPFTVFLNGQKIAEGSSSIAGKRLKVPKGILEKGVFNTIAVRLGKDERFAEPPVFRTYFDELVLGGEWDKFSGDATALKPLTQSPEKAAFTEKAFRLSTMPLVATENIPGQRLSPADSLAKMRVEPVLAVELILAEPLVAQPTHMSFDEHGRLWVSQYRQYPYPAGIRQLSRDQYYRAVFDKVPPPPPNHDRGADIISVHEDTDGDGVFDSHKNVLEGLNMANAAVYGHGGIWVMNTPYLMFYPDKNGDDIPDGPPEVRLSGFGLEDTHSIANGLVWGPDGWLYGGQGSTVTCRVKRPDVDSPNSPGVYFEGCMVWRYHPTRKTFEIFAEGGGNTFGLEFDAEGNLFSGHNGGDTRGWHFIQNGIYLKQGKDPGKFGATGHEFSFGEFGPMKSANPIQRFTHNIIMVEGTAVPTLRGKLLGADPLHRNITASERITVGATFSTKDTGIPLAGDDIAFRPVFLANAPDGSVFVADFYEEYIAHGQNYQGQLDPTTGRIYRLRGKDAPLERDLNLKSKTTPELIALLRHPNKWHRMTAVRLLGERKDKSALEPLKRLLAEKETHPALDALWALHQAGLLKEEHYRNALHHPSSDVRSWAFRLACESDEYGAGLAKYMDLDYIQSAPRDLRLSIATQLRRLTPIWRSHLLYWLIRLEPDSSDPILSLLCWWSFEDAMRQESSAGTFAKTLELTGVLKKQPMMRDVIAPRMMRRFAASGTRTDFLAASRLLNINSPENGTALVAAFEGEFKGRQIPPLPDELVSALINAGSTSIGFRIRRGDSAAVSDALKLIADQKAKLEERQLCIRTLGETKTAACIQPLLALATTDASNAIRRAALGALLPFDDAQIGAAIAAQFASIPKDAQSAAITLLASRDTTRAMLLTLVENGTLAATDVPPDAAAWLREKSADRERAARALPVNAGTADRAKFDRIRAVLAAGNGNPYDGEATYMARCAACHQLFHKGGKIGPNLTAYQREDIGTMLTSVLTPNAEIREGFENFTITTKDGRTLGGFVTDKDANVVTLRGLDGQDIALPRDQITGMKSAGRSLMPEGLLEGLTDQQLRDFFAYLRIPQPISR